MKKYKKNPILQKPESLIGVVYSLMFHDKTGKLRIVFRSHNSSTKIHSLKIYSRMVYFENIEGMEIMQLGNNIFSPVLLKKAK